MKKAVFSLSAAVLCLFLAGLASAATVNINMVDFAFQPSSVTVNVGDTVVWTNMGSTFHTTTSGSGCMPNGMWDSGTLPPGQSFPVTFNTAGTFPFFCSIHCASNNMVGTVIVNAAAGQTIPVPTAPFVTTFQPVGSPALSTDPAHAEPIGIGNLGSGTLSLQIGLDQFAGPVDVYFLIFVPSLSPSVFQLTASDTLQPISMGFAPLMPNTMGPISETLANIPVAALPHGQYFFAVLVTPPGDTSLARFDAWITVLSL